MLSCNGLCAPVWRNSTEMNTLVLQSLFTRVLRRGLMVGGGGWKGWGVRTQKGRGESVIGITGAETGLPGPVPKENNNNKPVLPYTGPRHRRKIQALKKPPIADGLYREGVRRLTSVKIA